MKIEVHESDEMGNVYRLLEPITYKDLTVPAGFESDGASVPRFFWRSVFPPGDSKALYAAFVHDYIYRTHPEGWTKHMADKAFLDLLIQGGIRKISAYKAYLGVVLFGYPSWKAGEKK